MSRVAQHSKGILWMLKRGYSNHAQLWRRFSTLIRKFLGCELGQVFVDVAGYLPSSIDHLVADLAT